MRDHDKREQLLEFLDKKVFDPVLEATPQQYSSERDRKLLSEIQKKAALEKDLLHEQARTAEEVRNYYLKDLYYELVGRDGKALEDLELPRLREVRNEFLVMCEQLEI